MSVGTMQDGEAVTASWASPRFGPGLIEIGDKGPWELAGWVHLDRALLGGNALQRPKAVMVLR